MPVLFSSFESKNIPVKSKKSKPYESRNTPKEVAKVLKTEEVKKGKVLTTEEKKDRYKEAI